MFEMMGTCDEQIVQFVALHHIASASPEVIARNLLAEIPRQVTTYMKMMNITPDEIHRTIERVI